MTAASTESELARRAREVLAGLSDEGVHCIRRVAYCEVMHADRRKLHTPAMLAWARGVDTDRRVPRKVLIAFESMGLIAFEGGSVLTDLGHEVARLLSEVARG